jgi:protein SCO1/2
LLVVASLAVLVSCRRSEPLPQLFPVPDATLVTDASKPLKLSSMKGYVTVYDFIFTQCAGTCPLMTQTMNAIAKAIPAGEPVRFVSISVDPKNDTPEALGRYAKAAGRDSRWIFLTADRDTIMRLSTQGFKLALDDAPPQGSEAILHSTKLVVVDKSGTVRAYHDGTALESRKNVVRDITTLLEE